MLGEKRSQSLFAPKASAEKAAAIWVRISMKPALENPSPQMSRCVTPQLMMGQGLKLIPQIA